MKHAIYNRLLPLALSALLAGAAGPALAEKLKIPVGQQGPDPQLERPANGVSKWQVEQRYGQPENWTSQVGEPPISSWEYNGFTVYFEGEFVIHTVLKP